MQMLELFLIFISIVHSNKSIKSTKSGNEYMNEGCTISIKQKLLYAVFNIFLFQE